MAAPPEEQADKTGEVSPEACRGRVGAGAL